MASVLQQYHQLADRMATQITGSYQSWTDFLTTAARLYKYPYHEQLMIYAQRPEATACADYELWNKRMGRYVRRGAKGIALIDHSGDTPKLKYVFDVADTRTTERSRSPYLWEFHPEHEQTSSDTGPCCVLRSSLSYLLMVFLWFRIFALRGSGFQPA